MFGCLESERKRREKRENEGQKQGPVLGMLEIKVRLQNLENGLYSLKNRRKYQSNLTSIITMRVEMKLTKNGVVCTENKGTRIFST